MGSFSASAINGEIGKWLSALRLRAKVTINDAASAIDQCPEDLQRVEIEGWPIPCSDIAKLVMLYGVPPTEAVHKILDIQYSARKLRP